MWNILNFLCTIVHTTVLQKKNNAQFKLMRSTDSATLNLFCVCRLKHVIPPLRGRVMIPLNEQQLSTQVLTLGTPAGPHRSRELSPTAFSRDNQSIMYVRWFFFFASVSWPQTWICDISKSSISRSVFKMQSQPASWTGLEISSSTRHIGTAVCGLARGQPERSRRPRGRFEWLAHDCHLSKQVIVLRCSA